MATDKFRSTYILFLPVANAPTEHAWQPGVDIYRMPDGWLVKLELAGVRPEDVRVSVANGALIVQGARRDEFLQEGLQCYRMEISYSQFERVLELPGILEAAEVVASHRHGMLLVRILSEARP